jgi:hypothetical protein
MQECSLEIYFTCDRCGRKMKWQKGDIPDDNSALNIKIEPCECVSFNLGNLQNVLKSAVNEIGEYASEKKIVE